MKNRINKNYSFETILAALIITNLINIIIKKMGLPILVLLLSLFLYHNGKEHVEEFPKKPNIENVIGKTP